MIGQIGIAYLGSCLFLFFTLAGSQFFRLYPETERAEERSLLNLPIILLTLAFVGCIFSTSVHSASFYLFLLLGLGAFQIRFSRKEAEIDFYPFLVFHLLFLLKVSVLYNWEIGTFNCTHHDDYNYLQQISLLETTKRESIFTELYREIFGLEYAYRVYHYFEFYVCILFKSLFRTNAYVTYHFFLLPYLGTLAFTSFYSFTRSIGVLKPNRWFVFLFCLLIFCTIRYTMVDEFVKMFVLKKYFKVSFFQNYSVQHPLSYFFGYKLCIAFLFVLPVVYLSWKSKLSRSGFYVILSGVASIALIPFTVLLSIFPIVKKWIGPRVLLGLSVLILLSTWVYLGIVSGSEPTSIPKTIYLSYLTFFNLFFENFYWCLFYFALLVLLSTRSKIHRAFAGLLLVFPLIYFDHNLLFKVYSILLLAFYVFLEQRKKLNWNSPLLGIVVALLLCYSFCSLLSWIPDINQIYTNILFLVACAAIGLGIHSIKLKSYLYVNSALAITILLVSVPSLAFDNRMPIRTEKPEGDLNKFLGNSDLPTKVLSFSTFSHLPFIYHDQLGASILNQFDNYFIIPARFNTLLKGEVAYLKNTGFYSVLTRNPYFDFMQSIEKDDATTIAHFVKANRIRLILVKEDMVKDAYFSQINPLKYDSLFVEGGNYWIFRLK